MYQYIHVLTLHERSMHWPTCMFTLSQMPAVQSMYQTIKPPNRIISISYTQYLNLYFMIQKDAHHSPCSTAPETPTGDSHLEHVHDMVKNTTARHAWKFSSKNTSGREFTHSVNAQRRRSLLQSFQTHWMKISWSDTCCYPLQISTEEKGHVKHSFLTLWQHVMHAPI
jgi:hypothetical protein